MGVIIEIYVLSILDATIINLILWVVKIQYVIVLNQEFSSSKMFIKEHNKIIYRGQHCCTRWNKFNLLWTELSAAVDLHLLPVKQISGRCSNRVFENYTATQAK